MLLKSTNDYHDWCYKFLAKYTLPLSMDFEAIATKLAIYIAHEVNTECDKTLVESAKFNKRG